MHRWVWDLHYPAPDAVRHEYPIAAIPGDTPRSPLGPSALPGRYTARLTANGKSYETKFTVKMDPRVKIPEAALEKKFHSEMQLASLMTKTSAALRQAQAIRESLQKLAEQLNGSTLASLQAFEKKLTAVLGAPPSFAAPPTDEVTLTRVNGQAASLYGQVWQADAQPTSSQTESIAVVERDVLDGMKRWDAFRSTDLPAFNRTLRDANLPEVKLESDPDREETVIDE